MEARVALEAVLSSRVGTALLPGLGGTVVADALDFRPADVLHSVKECIAAGALGGVVGRAQPDGGATGALADVLDASSVFKAVAGVAADALAASVGWALDTLCLVALGTDALLLFAVEVGLPVEAVGTRGALGGVVRLAACPNLAFPVAAGAFLDVAVVTHRVVAIRTNEALMGLMDGACATFGLGTVRARTLVLYALGPYLAVAWFAADTLGLLVHGALGSPSLHTMHTGTLVHLASLGVGQVVGRETLLALVGQVLGTVRALDRLTIAAGTLVLLARRLLSVKPDVAFVADRRTILDTERSARRRTAFALALVRLAGTVLQQHATDA